MKVRYLRAHEWGMRWARPPIAEKMPDGETYVHHTAGAHVDDAIAAFQSLNEYAIAHKDYSALDYDLLVHRNKATGLVTIGEGRGRFMSAATLDRNEEGEAVCVLGYFHPGSTLSRKPHPDEVEGVALATVWGITELGIISPATVIRGHRDNPAHPGATGCPGDYLQAELPTVRRRVAEILAPVVKPAPTPPPSKDYPMELFTLAPLPAALYQRTGHLVTYVDETQWVRMGNPMPSRVMPAGEAASFTLLGDAPDADAFSGQAAA